MTYWGRAAVAGTGIFVAAYVLVIGELFRQAGGGNQAGQMIFWIVGALSLILAGAAGMIYTADIVSKERRDGTLGLLFLTDLRGWEVALGKLASSSFGAFYGLIAIQPIMAIALLLGGVTGGEYARMCLIIVVAATSSLCVGLFCSTCGRSAQTPPLLAVCIAFFVCGFPPLVGSLLELSFGAPGQNTGVVHSMASVLYLLTPIRAFSECADLSFRSRWWHYWIPVFYTATIGLSAVATTIWRLPRIFQDTATESPGSSKQTNNSAPKPFAPLRHHLDENPIVWLVIRQRLRHWIPLTIGIAYAVLGVVSLASSWYFAGDPMPGVLITNVTGGGVFIARFLFQVWIANEAGRQLLADRRSGTIELQLVTPLTGQEFVSGHLDAFWKTIRTPIILVAIGLVAGTATLLIDAARGGNRSNPLEMSPYALLLVSLLSIASFLTSCWALSMTSLDGAMTLKNGRIALRALGLIILVPCIAWMLFMPVLMFTTITNTPAGPKWTMFLMTSGMPLISLVNSLVWGTAARRRLFAQFRAVAGVPMETGPKQVRVPPAKAPPPHPAVG